MVEVPSTQRNASFVNRHIVHAVVYGLLGIILIVFCDIAWCLWDVTQVPQVTLPNTVVAGRVEAVRAAAKVDSWALQRTSAEIYMAPALSQLVPNATFVKLHYVLRRPYLWAALSPANVGFWRQVLVVPDDPSIPVSAIRMLSAKDFEQLLILNHTTVNSADEAAVVYQAWYESAYCYQYQAVGKRANISQDEKIICEKENSTWKMGRTGPPPRIGGSVPWKPAMTVRFANSARVSND